ncbi:hypothetical protein ABN154_06055 [Klebsiella michiganensis]|uniref:hypothetical protein n=1 Tax=Klebsiella michiganensis TaxID=1134687 RepID=UPI0032DBE292
MKSVTVEKFFPSLASNTVTRVDAILTDTSARLWGVLSSGKKDFAEGARLTQWEP